MSRVTISEVELCTIDEAILWNRQIDLPGANTQQDSYFVRLEGWLLAKKSRPKSVHFLWNDARVSHAKNFVERPDVMTHFGNLPDSIAAGFYAEINTILYPENFEITVAVRFEDGSEANIGIIRGKRRPLIARPSADLQPVGVFGLARSGTTLLMRYLLNHPQMVGFNEYPYELRMMSYLLQVIGTLGSRANHQESSHPDSFIADNYHVGFNPFNLPEHYGKVVGEWFGGEHLEDLAAFAVKSLDSFYSTLAASQGKEGVRCFVEKAPAFARRVLLWTLYPQSRAIFLVRDPRDRHCSVLSFNEKRGFKAFGFEASDSEAEFVRNSCRELAFELATLRLHPTQVTLIRYEDLIQGPRESLLRIFKYLGLDSDDATLAQAMAHAEVQDARLDEHRTTEAGRSIGRWKTDLDPSIARLYVEMIGDVMAELGYEE